MGNLDLFRPVVPEAAFHPNFRHVLRDYSEADRAVLLEWAEGFEDRDGKFVSEFQRTFNTAFWELYLFAVTKELGLHVDFRFTAPDFVITNFWNEFCIEATTAHNARGKTAEWEVPWPRLRPNPETVLEEATIRLANALTGKYSKYQESYAQMDHVTNRPFVIAIAPFEQPGFHIQNDHAIRRVVYGYDRPVVHDAPDGAGRRLEHMMLESVQKETGATIRMGYFKQRLMNEVSAVIFSNTATVGKVRALSKDVESPCLFCTLRYNAHGPDAIVATVPKRNYDESLLDGLYVFHNPYATVPLDFSPFRRRDVTQYTWLPGEPLPRVSSSHGFLIQRSVVTLRSKSKTSR